MKGNCQKMRRLAYCLKRNLPLFLLLIVTGCATPRFSQDDRGNGVIQIGNLSCQVLCVAPDARLLKWWRWQPDFPDWYVFEIDAGTAVGVGRSTLHNLVIIDASDRKMRILLEEPIYESTTRYDEASGELMKSELRTLYRLGRDEYDRPVVSFGDESRWVTLPAR